MLIKIKSFFNQIGLLVFLFLVFFSYRLYFWGDPTKHFNQVLLNAIGDTILSFGIGLIIFQIKQKFAHKKWYFRFISFGLILIAIGLDYLYHVFIYRLFSIYTKDFIPFFNSICFQLLDSVAIIVSGALAKIMDGMQKEKRKLADNMVLLTQEKLVSELNYLKAQMDPHFIFNSLNTIFYQIKDEDFEAKESVTQFSEILRYHMQSSSQSKVNLSEELVYINAYIDFQSKRCKDFYEVRSEFEVEDCDFEIEPLLLMPLIENAFKFVGSDFKEKGWIKIKAIYRNNRFEFDIKNTFNPKEIIKNKGIGIGLQNVMKRLSLLYKDKHILSFDETVLENSFNCKLVLWK